MKGSERNRKWFRFRMPLSFYRPPPGPSSKIAIAPSTLPPLVRRARSCASDISDAAGLVGRDYEVGEGTHVLRSVIEAHRLVM